MGSRLDEPIIQIDPTLKVIKIIIVCVSGLLFLMSLTQVAFCTDHDEGSCWGSINALLMGCFYPSGPGLCWYANPMLVVACIVISKRPVLALVLGLLASLTAFSFLQYHEILNDEAGHMSHITSVKSGYWLWLLSCVSSFVGSAVMVILTLAKKGGKGFA